ncbi:hypothetical protein E8E14_001698 [Neopestalotiopsis sp. 37M]|nr:hypothetical protein E8E14_001698 [Neopestalotiopsis sp. 37M]
MQSIIKSVLLAAATVRALPQPFPQDAAAATDPPAVMTPEEAAAQALRSFMPSGFSVRANQIIPVVVGGPQDTFVPNVVTAAVGDVVQFQFSNGNHTVTQSAQDVGCQPLQARGGEVYEDRSKAVNHANEFLKERHMIQELDRLHTMQMIEKTQELMKLAEAAHKDVSFDPEEGFGSSSQASHRYYRKEE